MPSAKGFSMKSTSLSPRSLDLGAKGGDRFAVTTFQKTADGFVVVPPERSQPVTNLSEVAMQDNQEMCPFRTSSEYGNMKELYAEYGLPHVNESFIDEFLCGNEPDDSYIGIFMSDCIFELAAKGMNDGRLAPLPEFSVFSDDMGFGIVDYTAIWYAYMIFDHFISKGDYLTAIQATELIGIARKMYDNEIVTDAKKSALESASENFTEERI